MIVKEMFPTMVANVCGKIVFAMPLGLDSNVPGPPNYGEIPPFNNVLISYAPRTWTAVKEIPATPAKGWYRHMWR